MLVSVDGGDRESREEWEVAIGENEMLLDGGTLFASVHTALVSREHALKLALPFYIYIFVPA